MINHREEIGVSRFVDENLPRALKVVLSRLRQFNCWQDEYGAFGTASFETGWRLFCRYAALCCCFNCQVEGLMREERFVFMQLTFVLVDNHAFAERALPDVLADVPSALLWPGLRRSLRRKMPECR